MKRKRKLISILMIIIYSTTIFAQNGDGSFDNDCFQIFLDPLYNQVEGWFNDPDGDCISDDFMIFYYDTLNNLIMMDEIDYFNQNGIDWIDFNDYPWGDCCDDDDTSQSGGGGGSSDDCNCILSIDEFFLTIECSGSGC